MIGVAAGFRSANRALGSSGRPPEWEAAHATVRPQLSRMRSTANSEAVPEAVEAVETDLPDIEHPCPDGVAMSGTGFQARRKTPCRSRTESSRWARDPPRPRGRCPSGPANRLGRPSSKSAPVLSGHPFRGSQDRVAPMDGKAVDGLVSELLPAEDGDSAVAAQFTLRRDAGLAIVPCQRKNLRGR